MPSVCYRRVGPLQREFGALTRARPAAARIKRNKKTGLIKFKIRCKKDLCTLVLRDSDKADKLKQSLPPRTISAPFPTL